MAILSSYGFLTSGRGVHRALGMAAPVRYTFHCMLQFVLRLPNSVKRTVAVVTDAALLAIAVVGAYLLRLDDWRWLWPQGLWAMVGVAVAGPVTFQLSGLYREITRYVGPVFVLRVVKAVAILSLFLTRFGAYYLR